MVEMEIAAFPIVVKMQLHASCGLGWHADLIKRDPVTGCLDQHPQSYKFFASLRDGDRFWLLQTTTRGLPVSY